MKLELSFYRKLYNFATEYTGNKVFLINLISILSFSAKLWGLQKVSLVSNF